MLLVVLVVLLLRMGISLIFSFIDRTATDAMLAVCHCEAGHVHTGNRVTIGLNVALGTTNVDW